MSDLTKRLRGKYSFNTDTGVVCEDRDFGDYTPKINVEAAKRIEELENHLKAYDAALETEQTHLNWQNKKAELLK